MGNPSGRLGFLSFVGEARIANPRYGVYVMLKNYNI